MYEVEIWFDVELRTETESEILCTIFGEISLPMRPLVAETISFHQDPSSSLLFRQFVPDRGNAQVHTVTIEVDLISHYGVRDNDGRPLFRTQVRCDCIGVPSIEDAKVVRLIMESQFGMKLDPYAINKLDA